MPYQLVHNGVVREFEFYPPVGWHYWHERVFTEDGRNGLPLVIALHGGAQSPSGFALDWPFPLVSNPADETNWEDRFFVLYPYGHAYYHLAGEPVRGWNTGFADDFLPVQSDVSFIRAAVDAVEEMLRRKLGELGVTRPPIDADRRFVFGYSMGGMMAYKLAHEIGDHFAALWVMAGAIGGRSHEGLTGTITNDPTGRSAVSLFAHHGELDVVVPPGPQQDTSGRVQSTYRSRSLRRDRDARRRDPDAQDVVAAPGGRDRDLQTAQRLRADGLLQSARHRRQHDIRRGRGRSRDTSLKFVFRRTDLAPNPEVIVYRDPTMDHTNFTDAGQYRYFDAADVWNFFKSHPSVPV